jgi:biopolymer transport protein ExbB/TolQ
VEPAEDEDVVAKDLGTWPPEQATVLVQVLQRANLTPEAKRTRDGILVTVPDDQADVAVRALADNMDAIADAARSRAEARRRRARSADARTTRDTGRSGESPLTSERLRGAARPIAILLVGLLVLSTVARVSPLLALIGVGIGIYLLGRRVQDGQDGMGGPGGPFR